MPGHDFDDHLSLSGLGSHFSQLSARLAQSPGGTLSPQRVTLLAAAVVPHAAHCGLTVIRRERRPRTVASSDEVSD